MTCERCWSDAYHLCVEDHHGRYRQLVAERNCTPEQQAGPDAEECARCKHRTVHQYAHICTACGSPRLPAVRAEGP